MMQRNTYPARWLTLAALIWCHGPSALSLLVKERSTRSREENATILQRGRPVGATGVRVVR